MPKKDQQIYLHVIKWPDGPAKELVRIHRPHFEKAKLLDSKLKGFAATSSETNGVITVQLQRPDRVDPFATVIQFDFTPE